MQWHLLLSLSATNVRTIGTKHSMPTLLVIDDEAGIRFTIREVLQNQDLRVLAAENAEEGLRLTREESPDVVLLDIRLGAESGLDVFHRLRAIDPKLLVVFITGHGTAETAIEAMKLGAFDYLVKPLDLGELQQVVEQALKISHLVHVPAAVESDAQLSEASDRSDRQCACDAITVQADGPRGAARCECPAARR